MDLELKYGYISDVRPGSAKVFFNADGFPSGWLPVLVRKSKTNKESWQLEVNEHVVCLMLDNCDEGIILGAIPSEKDAPDPGEAAGKFRKLFADGSIIEYDTSAHCLLADIKGDIKAKGSNSVEIIAGTHLKAKATLSAEIEAATVLCKASVSAEVEALTITLKGNTIITGTLTVINGLTAATIATSGSGSIVSAGNLTVQGAITGAEVKAGAIDLVSHKHAGVQPGSGISGPSSP